MKTSTTGKRRGRPKRKHMKLITLHLPEHYIQTLDKLVEQRYYSSRAEAIRAAIRDMLLTEAWGTYTKNKK